MAPNTQVIASWYSGNNYYLQDVEGGFFLLVLNEYQQRKDVLVHQFMTPK